MYKAFGAMFCVILVAFFAPNCDFVNSFGQISGAKVYFCTTERIDSGSAQVIKNGNGYIISTQLNKAKRVQNAIKSDILSGISIYIDSEFDSYAYLNKIGAKIIFDERIENELFIYAYSTILPRYTSFRGQKINLQIIARNGTTTIGYPLILTGA